MNTRRSSLGLCVLLAGASFLVGCGKDADEDKPLTEVKAEAKKMGVDELRESAVAYKDAILAKRKDLTKLADKLKDVPLTEIVGDEAKELKGEIETLTRSVQALKERFDVYFTNLKDKKGDLSDLKL
jgi:ABC-type phosphate transport system auxiliary subunit